MDIQRSEGIHNRPLGTQPESSFGCVLVIRGTLNECFNVSAKLSLPCITVFASGVDMANSKVKLPPPIDPKKMPVTLDSLTSKLDAFFENVKELVQVTARGTENVLRKEIQRLDAKIDGVEKNLSDRIDGVEEKLSNVEKNLSEKIDKIGERVEDHETRITTLEKSEHAL